MNSADGELWASLPSPLRTRIDELVLRDNEFAAIRALWTSGVEPRPRLHDCQGLIAFRYRELGDRVERVPEPARDLTTLTSQVNALPRRPAAIEALWDGDTRGWFVLLLAVMTDPPAETTLAAIRHGGDLRLFNGQVPPWPEAQEAMTTGPALAEHFGLPFHFPSSDTPDDEAPRWRNLQ